MRSVLFFGNYNLEGFFMLLSDIDIEKIALIFAHYAYRNTKVEDLHAGDSVLMDDAVYSEVYKIVSKKIRAMKKTIFLFLKRKMLKI